jgi:hypothetical protein
VETVLRASLWILILVLLTSCNKYTLQDAKKNGDIIAGDIGGTLNTEKMTQFMNDLDKNQDSKLRITMYTIEGDPIISDLHYDGKTIRYSYDTSQDKYGNQSKGKSETTCEKINKKEIAQSDINVKGTQYVLTGCKKIIGESHKNEIYVLFVPQ